MEGEWVTLQPSRFTPSKEPGTHWIRVWVHHIDDLGMLRTEKYLVTVGIRIPVRPTIAKILYRLCYSCSLDVESFLCSHYEDSAEYSHFSVLNCVKCLQTTWWSWNKEPKSKEQERYCWNIIPVFSAKKFIANLKFLRLLLVSCKALPLLPSPVKFHSAHFQIKSCSDTICFRIETSECIITFTGSSTFFPKYEC
jgi:hypothetical protein